MKAIRIHQFGETEEVLKYEDVPIPEPGPEEILVKIEAAILEPRGPVTPHRQVLEMVGGDVYNKSLEVLTPGGRLVSIGGAAGPVPDPPPALTDGRKASRFSITSYLQAHPEGFKQLDTFLEQARDNTLQVIIDRTFPLAEVQAAQRYLKGREHFGKVVLTMG